MIKMMVMISHGRKSLGANGLCGKKVIILIITLENIWSMPGISFSLKKKAYNGSIVLLEINYKDYNILLKSVCIFNLYDCVNS